MKKGKVGLILVIGGPQPKGTAMGKTKRFTREEDDAYDKKHGIKEGSKRDKKLDAERGIPEPKTPFKGMKKKGKK